MLWTLLTALASGFPATNATIDPLIAAGERAVVHEWGTFTSLHRPDGDTVRWRVLQPTHALPDFVDTFQGTDWSFGEALCRSPFSQRHKGGCHVRIRMETPVIYVHSEVPARMRFSVRFDRGIHTEWYPSAGSTLAEDGDHVLDWGWVSVEPSSTAPLPVEPAPSPYYAARDVDAALLHVGTEVERFLFYRGVGDFTPEVRPVTTDDAVRWDGTGARALVVYEHSAERTGAVVLRGAGTVQRSALTAGDPRDALRALLLAEGLYADEVEAMLATWEADWFEPGLRAFYLLPRAQVDARLVLDIEPAPAELVRVIVGRAELTTPAQVAHAKEVGLDVTLEAEPRFGWGRAEMAGLVTWNEAPHAAVRAE